MDFQQIAQSAIKIRSIFIKERGDGDQGIVWGIIGGESEGGEEGGKKGIRGRGETHIK